ncbi:MAG: efflux RND transporter periplasmic adaptor subunit [Pseudomonadota bacterium]
MISIRNSFTLWAGLVLAGCGGERGENQQEPPVRPAKIITVSEASDRRIVSLPAVVRAAQSAELTFETPGRVEDLNVLQAQEVEAGYVIAKLDQRNAQNNLQQAEAEYENAVSEFDRAERLFARDAISRSVLDQRRTQRDVSEVAVANAKKALDDTVLTAPFSGGISRVYVEQFQNIQAKEPIALIQSSDVEAVINVPGTIIARIPQLQRVGTTVVLDAAPGLKIPGQFKEASGVADPNTQTYEISFSFEAPEDVFILPGMTGSVSSTFVFQDANDLVASGVAAPLSAILAEGDGRFVWVVEPDTGGISKRAVSVANEPGETVTITEGLESGEQIVAAGVSFLFEGMRVRQWTPE